jgi:hypothetical protein
MRVGMAEDAPAKGNAPHKESSKQNLILPSAESTVVIIRSALLALDHALATGNFTVLRDLASPSFQQANSAEQLGQIFANLRSQQFSLSAVAILVPKLPQAPMIDDQQRLRISGYFPGDPVQINFELQFEAVAGRWRLFGIGVTPTKTVKASPPTETPSSGSGKPSSRPPR